MMRLTAYLGFCLTLVCVVLVTTAAWAANPPGLMHSTLLNGVKLHYDTGNLYLDNIQAVFLPDAQSTTIYAYNPDDGGKLWAILSQVDGTEVARYDFYGEKLKAPYWLLNSYKLTYLGEGEAPANKRLPLQPGNYVLNFFLETGLFYTYPFSISVVPSSSAFDPGDFYFIDGDWNHWGYLYYWEANPEQSLCWKVWLRNKEHKSDKSVSPRVEIWRDKGNKLVCTSRKITLTLNPSWVRYDFDMIFPMEGTSGGAYFKAKDLLATDGSYTLKMTLDGKPYGAWKFKVVGGKLNYTGRTLRGQADPLTFVEGGIDAWWYTKQSKPKPTPPPTGTTGAGEIIVGATPIQIGGTTLVPLRPIFEWLGAQVKFDAATGRITAVRNEHVVELTLGSATALVGGEQLTLTVAAQQRSGQTYVPLRFVAEAFGAQIKWDAATQTVTILDGSRTGIIRAP